MAIEKQKVPGSQLRERAAAERDSEIKILIKRAAKAIEDSKKLVQTSAELVRDTKARRKKRAA